MAKAKKSAIGKGLAQLLEEKPAEISAGIQNIGLEDIIQSETNPRRSFSHDSIRDLSESMAQFGLIQPITLRPHGEQEGKFEIVAGERRFRAAQMLYWDTIPAIVRAIGDEEMLEIQIIENLQREDVSPMDEAAAFKSLLKKETIDWLCSRIHKSKKYVQDRLKLNELIEDAREYVHDGVLPLSHALLISKLPAAEQEKCLKECISEDHFSDRIVCKKTVADLRSFSEGLLIDFDKACFDLDDASLVPSAGACSACDKRTCNQALLFQEITEDDMCTNPACFLEKEKAFVSKSLSTAKEQYEKVYSGDQSGYAGANSIKVQGIDISISRSPTKKETACAVITKASAWNRDRLGSFVFFDPKKLDSEKKKKEENKQASSQTRSMSWEERDSLKFKNIVYPRLLKIASIIEKDQLSDEFAENIANQELKHILSRAGDREIVSLSALLGLHPIGGSEDILVNCGNDVKEDELIEFIGKIISRVPGSIAQKMAVAAMINCISDENEDIRDESDFNEFEGYRYNWGEIMAIINL